MAARTSPTSSSELTVVIYIIYTNLTPKQQNSTSSSLNKIPIAPTNNIRITNSVKTNTNNNLIRERASTILLPPVKANLVVPIRSNSTGSEQTIGNNIPTERNVEFFK